MNLPDQQTAFAVMLGAGGVAIAVAAVVAYRVWMRKKLTPEERERRRRESLAATGKITGAELVEFREDHLFYAYSVAGVEYTASQDITALRDYMPSELGLGMRSVSVKYDSRLPANSIVLSERWSGLHPGKA